jgi:hypothetical protein
MALLFNNTDANLMNLVQIFGQIAQDHAQVNAFGFGDVWNITAETIKNYPLLWVSLLGNKIGNNTITYKLRVYWMDLVKPDISNENEIKSNSIMILNGIFYLLRDLYDLEPEFDVNVVPFEEKFSDRVAGSYADVDILVPNTFGWCDEPMKDCSASGSTFVPFPIQTDGGCGGSLSVLNSPTVSFDGSGTTCLPLIANVNISAFPGNTLIANIDGLYVSGSTSTAPFLASTQIAFGSSGNTITSSSGLSYSPSEGLQTLYLLVTGSGDEDLIIAENGFVGFNVDNTTFGLSAGGIDILTEGTSSWDSTGGFTLTGAITATSLQSTGVTMVVANSSGLLSTLPLPTFSNVFGADDGLSINGTNAILGGVTLTNKEIDLSVNNNTIWFKESLAPSSYSQFIVGGASGGTTPGQVWGFPHPSILISKSITADGNNSVFMEMSNPDAPTGSSYNGMLFLNYQNVAGQVQPNIRCASNALAGQGGAYNLDLVGRDSYSVDGYQDNYSHFSIWYYDYDQYFYTNPGAPGPMLNSDFVNFNNGQGGGVGSTRFFMIDKHYNTLLGKAAWNATPAATLDIQDNGSGQTGIYQRGATSPNWFAGDTVIGGPLPTHFGSTYQLTVSGNTQITGVLELTGMTTPDQDGAGPGMISCQGIPLLHFGANDNQDTYSVYLGMYAGYAARNTSGADVQSAVAVGFGALQAYTGVQAFWGSVLGTGCAQELTSGIGDLIAGWATANTSTSLSGSTLLGSMAGVVVNGTDLTFVGVGAGGAPNYSNIYTATATASGSTVIGAWAGSGLSHVTMDNIILLGRFANKTTNNSVVWNNTTIIGNSITTDLNNVAIFGSSTQDIIIGNSNPTIDNGYKLQVNGSTYVSGNALITSLASTGTTMVVASSTGLLGTQPIPQGYTFTGNTSQYTTGAGTYVTFPTNLNQFINGPGYITGVTAVMIDTALGYTPIAGPAGSNQQIQFNNNGAFGGSIDFLWTGTSLLVTGSTEITYNGVGVVNGASGLTLINNTPATSTQEQYSPALIFGGNAWNTASSGSNYPVQYAIQEYVQSANTPYHGLNFMFSTNGGSSYTNIFSVGYEGGMPGINIGGSPTSGVDGGYILIDTAILPFNIYNNSNPNANNAGQFLLGGGAASNTSNSTYGIGIGSGYSAGAGSGNFAQLLINGTINQTTGSTGVMRGLYINPTLTSYANYYAIQVAAGNVVHAAATATYASLRIPTGTAPTAPIEGDMWKTGTHLFIYLNGATVQIV